MSGPILLAQISGAQGIRGEVRIATFTADPLALLDYNHLRDESGKPVAKIISARIAKTGIVARIEGVETRDQADALRGVRLFVAREDLPEPDEDEFYLTDLIGLACLDPEGTRIGTVKDIANFGAGDLLEIAPQAGGPTYYVAFTRETVPALSLAAGSLTLVMPTEID